MSVLAGINYPEKWYVGFVLQVTLFNMIHSFANYGGIPVKGEYCHESVRPSPFQWQLLILSRRCDWSSIRLQHQQHDTVVLLSLLYPFQSTSMSDYSYEWIPVH